MNFDLLLFFVILQAKNHGNVIFALRHSYKKNLTKTISDGTREKNLFHVNFVLKPLLKFGPLKNINGFILGNVHTNVNTVPRLLPTLQI